MVGAWCSLVLCLAVTWLLVLIVLSFNNLAGTKIRNCDQKIKGRKN